MPTLRVWIMNARISYRNIGERSYSLLPWVRAFKFFMCTEECCMYWVKDNAETPKVIGVLPRKITILT